MGLLWWVAQRAPDRYMGFAPCLSLALFFSLEHGGQPALTVPLAKSLAALVSIAVIFLFAQSLAA